MDWPRRPRSGRSRRDRNIALLGQGATAVAVIIGFVLLLLSRAAPERYASLRSAAADLAAPFWKVALVPLAELQAAAGSVADYLNAVENVRRLEGRERIYRQDRERYEQALRENRELKALLKVIEPGRRRIGVFAVSGSSTGAYVRFALISGGRRNGLLPGQPVLSQNGLIGRTVDVGSNATRVMLLTDVSSRVPVRIVRTGLAALAVGHNMPLLDVDVSAPSTADIRVGDRLVTSGDGGLFPPGIPVATIVATGDQVAARPAALPDGLDYVVVEAPFMPPAPREPEKQTRELHPEVAAQIAEEAAR